MIQMRWYVPAHRETVLQYRQMEDKNIYAAIANALTQEAQQTDHRNMQWSEWTDVPLVSERNPDHP
jgi:hypothetical protein